jgi:hypothetical protein
MIPVRLEQRCHGSCIIAMRRFQAGQGRQRTRETKRPYANSTRRTTDYACIRSRKTDNGLRLHRSRSFRLAPHINNRKFDSGYMDEAETATCKQRIGEKQERQPRLLKSFDNSYSAQSLPCSETRCPRNNSSNPRTY